MRIWRPAIWGVLVTLIGTTIQKPDNNDKTNPLININQPDRTPSTNSQTPPTSTKLHLQNDNISTSKTSLPSGHKRNLTNDTRRRQPLDDDITHKLTENHYKLTETLSESFQNKQLLNHKNNDNIYTLSITNNGNSGHTDKESIYLINPDNQHIHNYQENNTLNNKNKIIIPIKLNVKTEENKTEALFVSSRVDSDDISKVEHRQSSDGEFGKSDVVGGGRGREFAALKSREVEEAADYGLRMMKELITVKEPQLYTMGLWLRRDDPAGKVAAFSEPNPEALRLSRYGYASLQAATKLFQQLSSSVESRASPVRLSEELRESLRQTAFHSECPLLDAPIPCRPAARRYRTADGTCNNRDIPRRGAALTPMQRFLPPVYHDGIQTPRRSVIKASPLPSPRLISSQIHRPRHVNAPSVTLLLMQWGQFLDHDITSTPQSRAFNGSTPRCCDNGAGFLPIDLLHPECMPIEVPSDDWFFSRFGLRCMEFIRSAPTISEGCDFGHRQQLNQVTAYIDASTIYGSSVTHSDSIRLFQNGMIHYGLPEPPNGGEPCRAGAVSTTCIRPGDGRASEQPALTAIHITWVRKHNMIATALSHLNPHWSDEKMFQETRRIIAAMIQHITYREFLPIILGHEVMSLFDLEPVQKGYYTGYNSRVNPATSNSFSAAAFRFGHSLVQSSFIRSDRFHRPLFNNVTIHDEQSNANVENIWSPGSIDRLMLGLADQPAQRRDEFISEELTNHLFQSPGFPFGMDLAAINIQRGRDHGLPPYTAWREPCGLSPIRNWTDLQRVMSLETAERFRSIYLSVNDIDLFTAGLAERPVRGGLVGPTFACIIAQQFSNLRKGDRFWYENGNFESSFTPIQLQQIRKTTFAQIMCETMNQIDTIQPFVFLTHDSFRNQRIMCRDLIDFDLTPWIEKTPNNDQNNKITANVHEQFTGNDIEMKSDEFKFTGRNLNGSNINLITNNDKFIRNSKRIKRQLRNKYDQKEHREADDMTLPLTDQDLLELANKTLDTLTINFDELTNTTDANDESRNERKRKQPNRRKTKPKITTPKPVSSTTTVRAFYTKKKTKYSPDLKQVSFFTSNYNSRPNPYQTPEQYYETYSERPSYQNEVVIGGSKKPANLMTYLFNTVRKPATTTTTTIPKPDYQFHIQINYFYNSTTENYPKPTKPSYHRPTHNFDYNRPVNVDYNNFNFPTNRPNYHRPNTYNELDDLNPIYSASTSHNVYSKKGTTTQRPATVTSSPITVIEIKPQPAKIPEKPNVYVINQYDQNPTRPNTNYHRPLGYENNRPIYETRPDTLIYKRPITAQVTKLDNKPVLLYPDNPNFYGTEVVYDNIYTNYDKRRPAPIRQTYSSINDKLDYLSLSDVDKKFVKISTTNKNMFTTSRPYDDDKKYVRISTVKGQATSSDSLSPIYISVQNKEADGDDLEMTYDDLLEVYVKPDPDFKYPENYNSSDNKLKTIDEEKIENGKDDLCSTELPRPIDLLTEDELFDL